MVARLQLSSRVRRATAVVLLVALASLALGVGSASATFPGPNGPIVYPSFFINEGGDDGGLVSHGPKQKQKPRALTENADDQAPAFSPNGRLIAFEGNREATETPYTHIYVIRADGSGLRRLTKGSFRDSDPTFSANGKTVVFSRESTKPRQIHLFSVPLAGGEPTQLTSGAGFDTEPVATPNGRTLLFVSLSKGDARTDIYSMPAAGGARKLLIGGDRNQYMPDVSPNGRLVVYSSNLGGGPQLWLARISGARRHPITHSKQGCFGSRCFLNPAFSPDGTHLVFEDQGRYADDITVSRLDGSKMKTFEEAGREEEGFGTGVGAPAWGRAPGR